MWIVNMIQYLSRSTNCGCQVFNMPNVSNYGDKNTPKRKLETGRNCEQRYCCLHITKSWMCIRCLCKHPWNMHGMNIASLAKCLCALSRYTSITKCGHRLWSCAACFSQEIGFFNDYNVLMDIGGWLGLCSSTNAKAENYLDQLKVPLND